MRKRPLASVTASPSASSCSQSASQASARLAPAPAATPLTAQITGIGSAFKASYGRQEATPSSTLKPNGTPLFSAWGASELIRKSASIGYEGRFDVGTAKFTLYHNDFDNRFAGTTARAKDTTLDATLEKRLGWGVEQLLVMGAQWKDQELTNTDTIGTVPTDYQGNRVQGATLSGTTSARLNTGNHQHRD